MLSLARRALAAFHCSARCRVPMPGTKFRPKADAEQIRKVGDLLRTNAGIDEEAYEKVLMRQRCVSAVPLEQLNEQFAFWRRQFGLTKDELNKIARHFPQTFSLDPGLLAARWATLKQTLGWNKRQCREAIVKHPNIANASYGHHEERLGQYARLGLSTDEVLSAYRRLPQIMRLNHDSLRDTVDAMLELGYDSAMKDKLLNSAVALSILSYTSANIRRTAGVLREAGYSPNTISRLIVSGNYPSGHAPENVARSLAYVRDVMGRRLEDLSPHHILRSGVPRNVAPRYTALHKVHGAALDDVTNVHKNTLILFHESFFLKYGRITREAYDEVRRLTVPRFVVLWKEGEPLPPPDVALIDGDEAFLQRVGRADLLLTVAAARAVAAKEEVNGKRGTRKASRA